MSQAEDNTNRNNFVVCNLIVEEFEKSLKETSKQKLDFLKRDEEAIILKAEGHEVVKDPNGKISRVTINQNQKDNPKDR